MTSAPPKALVIDDDVDFLLVMRKMLQREGLAADTAPSAAKALDLFPQHQCDVILCDVHMPGMSGIDFYQELSARAPGAERRIIMLTGDVASEKTWEFIETWNVPYVLKPINADELRKKLRLMLGEIARPAMPPAAAAPAPSQAAAKTGAEARRHRRVPLQGGVRVQSIKSGTVEIAKILNASREGLLFLTARSHEVGTDLKVCYPYTGGANDIDVDAVVVRLEVRGSGQYGVAVATGPSAAVCRAFLKSAPALLMNKPDDPTESRVVTLAGFEDQRIRHTVSLDDFEKLKRQLEEERERVQRLDGELRAMRAARDRAVSERDQALGKIEEMRAQTVPQRAVPSPAARAQAQASPPARRVARPSPPPGTTHEFEFGEDENAAPETAEPGSMLDIVESRADPGPELLHLKHEIAELHRQLNELRDRTPNKH